MKMFLLLYVVILMIATNGVSAQSVDSVVVSSVVDSSSTILKFNVNYYHMTGGNAYIFIYLGSVTVTDTSTDAVHVTAPNGSFSVAMTGLLPHTAYQYRPAILYPFPYAGAIGTHTTQACNYITTASGTGTNTICTGGSDQLNVTVNGGTSPTYSWAPATGLNFSNISNPLATPTTTTTYSVTVIDGGCSETSSVTVTVMTTPVIIATVDAPIICNGTSTNLHANGTGVINWSWSPAIGLNNPNIANPIASPTTTTTYSVTGTNAGGCTGSTTKTITVSGSMTLTTTFDSITICPLTPTVLTASGATTYAWSNGLGSNPSVTVSPSVTTTYSVTGTSGGCQDVKTIKVIVNNVTVNGGGSTSVCSGSSVQLSATGATTYAWSNGMNGSPITVNPAITTTYTVTGSTAGCSSTSSVTVSVLPLPTIGLTASSTNICEGESVTLTASGGVTYSWSNGLGTGNPKIVFPTPFSSSYTVTGTDANGCSKTNSITIVVNQSPTLSFNPTADTICNGSDIVLTVSGALSYSWAPASSLVPNIGPMVQANPTSTTIYTVTGTGSNGCTSTATLALIVANEPILSSIIYSSGTHMLTCNSNGLISNTIRIVVNDTGVHTTIYQNSTQAVFYNIMLNDSDKVDIQDVGAIACDTIWYYFITGIHEQKGNEISIKQNEAIYLYDLTGRLIQKINSPKDYSQKEIFLIENLFDDISTGCYIWTSNTTGVPITRKFVK